MKWNGDMPAPFATFRIEGACSHVSRSRSRARHRRPKAPRVSIAVTMVSPRPYSASRYNICWR
jgi:hypothetical protein